MKVETIMSSPVITLSPHHTVREIASIFSENRISGAPVIDESGEMIGIVSETDLLPKLKRVPFTRTKLPMLFAELPGGETLEEMFAKARAQQAQDVMTKYLVTVSPDSRAADAALIMTENAIKRIPVLDSGRLVGILTRSDLIRAISQIST